MDFDSSVVRCLQAPADLVGNIDRLLNREPALYLEYAGETFWQVLHGDEVVISMLSDLEDVDYVGVGDVDAETGLKLEALDVVGVVGQVRVEDFEGYNLPRLAVPRPVDSRLPASSDPIEDPVPAYPLLRHRAPPCVVGQSMVVMRYEPNIGYHGADCLTFC